jgi:hypothetical protein
VDVSGNNVGHNLDCHGNKPKASNGIAGNNNSGHKSGECKNL